ncbi:MAG: T9SS type A sorting domain-containing protein [Bacteroidetes bacterium]|nr:T9SS type A sorting domain-containing protein [Bacteroidota bacterium]MCH7771954.1 T9SS type A sorting domain-containing protein [Bacteroidota bacterium]
MRNVTLMIYDLLGKEIKTLVNEQKNGDRFTGNLNIDNLVSGVYFYHLKINDFVDSKKIIVLK